jgi:glucosyl-3-phosphoglycerate synthase
VRRSLFETLSVPTGYAVELAALIDTLAARGPDAIAQVDLGRRSHAHQALLDLGAMATQILAAVHARQGQAVAEDVPLRQYRSEAGSIVPVERSVPLGERPPAVSV